jgi:uncharacterized protein YkwD
VRVRSLAVAAVAAFALVPVTGLPSSAATTTEPTATAASDGVWKSGATRRPRVRTSTSAALTVSQSYEARVLELTNLERSRRGLRTLAPSACADGFAGPWAATPAGRGTLSHQPLSPVLTACKARRVGENVAYGGKTADEVLQMWMASSGHRANILNPAFTHLGVGASRSTSGAWFAVQVFLTL